MEKTNLEIIVKNTVDAKIVEVEITCNNTFGLVMFVLTEDCRLLRIDVTYGHWRPGYGWADKPTWVDQKVTVREV